MRNTAQVDEKTSDFSFEYVGKRYDVNADLINIALRLPAFEGPPDNYTNETLFQLLRTLVYTGETTKIGGLLRKKLKKKWNFHFDCISRFFLDRINNFEALPSVSLKIVYSLIYSGSFDYGNSIQQYLFARKSDVSNVTGYTRFIQLIFYHLCPNVVSENDELLPVFKISDKEIKYHINRDKMNDFTGPVYILKEVSSFFQGLCLLFKYQQIPMLILLFILMLRKRTHPIMFLTQAFHPHNNIHKLVQNQPLPVLPKSYQL